MMIKEVAFNVVLHSNGIMSEHEGVWYSGVQRLDNDSSIVVSTVPLQFCQ